LDHSVIWLVHETQFFEYLLMMCHNCQSVITVIAYSTVVMNRLT